MQLVPFNQDSALPARLQNREARPDINKDVVLAPAFPTMSIKGKVFTLVKDGQRKLLTKPDDPDEVAQSIGVVIQRSNMRTKVFYLKQYVEGDSEGARPDCYSLDGVAPSPNSPAAQSTKCAVCPHNVWGSRMGDGDRPGQERKGKACADVGRLAISAPDKLDEPMLLRVPPASLKNLKEAVKLVDSRKVPYNEVVMKISFDPEAASPTLKFKPVAIINDADAAKIAEMYDSEIVKTIVGLLNDDGPGAAVPAADGPIGTEELDAAIAARAAANAAKAASGTGVPPAPAPAKPAEEAIPDAPAPTPAPTPAPKKAAAPKPTPAPTEAPAAAKVTVATPETLIADLDDLLGGDTDD